jgi:hypothetical protein
MSAAVALSGCSLLGDSDENVRNESGEIEEEGEFGSSPSTSATASANQEALVETDDTEGTPGHRAAPREESILFSSLTPSADTWGQGDREIVRLLVGQNGEQLTEDHQGSGV